MDVATEERNPVRRSDTGTILAPPFHSTWLSLRTERLVVGSGFGAAISVWCVSDRRLLRQIETCARRSGETAEHSLPLP